MIHPRTPDPGGSIGGCAEGGRREWGNKAEGKAECGVRSSWCPGQGQEARKSEEPRVLSEQFRPL